MQYTWCNFLMIPNCESLSGFLQKLIHPVQTSLLECYHSMDREQWSSRGNCKHGQNVWVISQKELLLIHTNTKSLFQALFALEGLNPLHLRGQDGQNTSLLSSKAVSLYDDAQIVIFLYCLVCLEECSWNHTSHQDILNSQTRAKTWQPSTPWHLGATGNIYK